MSGGTLAVRGPRSAEILTFEQLAQRAQVLAKTELVPKAFQDKPEAIILVGLYGQEHGVPLATALQEVYVIDNKPSPSAQLRLGMAWRAGHETEWVESSSDKAVLRGRRLEHRGRDDKWVTVIWTIEDARRAGLLDQWVEQWQKTKDGKNYLERWVIPADGDITDAPEWARKQISWQKIKRRDSWHRYPADMLRARAASTLTRMMCPDMLLAMGADPYTAEELGHDDGGLDVDEPVSGPADDDIEDAQVVPEPEGTPQPPAAPSGSALPPEDPPAPGPPPFPDTDRAAELVAFLGGWNKTSTPHRRHQMHEFMRAQGIEPGRHLGDYPLEHLEATAAEIQRRNREGAWDDQ